MEQYEIHIAFDEDEHGVIAYCDELNAVASGCTKEEARWNLLTAIQSMSDDYSNEVKTRLRGRVLTAVEVA
jgi:predicted RNase H-like HicB family nuclease